jgi:hypothetical protein
MKKKTAVLATEEDLLVDLKEAFAKNDHPRFRREFAANRYVPYGTAAAYASGVRNGGNERVARLIRITGMLLQTKVHLFWSSLRAG